MIKIYILSARGYTYVLSQSWNPLARNRRTIAVYEVDHHWRDPHDWISSARLIMSMGSDAVGPDIDENIEQDLLNRLGRQLQQGPYNIIEPTLNHNLAYFITDSVRRRIEDVFNFGPRYTEIEIPLPCPDVAMIEEINDNRVRIIGAR